MVDEQTILATERLKDELSDLRVQLRARYRPAGRQVTSDGLRKLATKIAEKWLVEIGADGDIAATIGPDKLANLNVHFQRLLTYAERATIRSKYDSEIRAILTEYGMQVILPLKQSRGRDAQARAPVERKSGIIQSAFVGQSFADDDEPVNQCVAKTLDGLGVKAVTGERPRGRSISEKVKRLIEEQQIFVGVFTRREKIARKPEWMTSSWVIDEKAYAVGRQKPLVLIRERGVESIGGIQGDYEFLEFSREKLEQLVISIIQVFDVTNNGLRG